MIARTGKGCRWVVIAHDDCVEEFEAPDYRAAIAEAKRLGYRPYNVGGVWLHECPRHPRRAHGAGGGDGRHARRAPDDAFCRRAP